MNFDGIKLKHLGYMKYHELSQNTLLILLPFFRDDRRFAKTAFGLLWSICHGRKLRFQPEEKK